MTSGDSGESISAPLAVGNSKGGKKRKIIITRESEREIAKRRRRRRSGHSLWPAALVHNDEEEEERARAMINGWMGRDDFSSLRGEKSRKERTKRQPRPPRFSLLNWEDIPTTRWQKDTH